MPIISAMRTVLPSTRLVEVTGTKKKHGRPCRMASTMKSGAPCRMKKAFSSGSIVRGSVPGCILM